MNQGIRFRIALHVITIRWLLHQFYAQIRKRLPWFSFQNHIFAGTSNVSFNTNQKLIGIHYDSRSKGALLDTFDVYSNFIMQRASYFISIVYVYLMSALCHLVLWSNRENWSSVHFCYWICDKICSRCQSMLSISVKSLDAKLKDQYFGKEQKCLKNPITSDVCTHIAYHFQRPKWSREKKRMDFSYWILSTVWSLFIKILCMWIAFWCRKRKENWISNHFGTECVANNFSRGVSTVFPYFMTCMTFDRL